MNHSPPSSNHQQLVCIASSVGVLPECGRGLQEKDPIQHSRMGRRRLFLGRVVGFAFLFAAWNIFKSVSIGTIRLSDEDFVFPTQIGGGSTRPKTRTLVTTQLPGLKSAHYTNYLMPSWRRLVEGRRDGNVRSREKVLPDLFIACAEEACDQIDRRECLQLNATGDAVRDRHTWRSLITDRPRDEMRCYFANVTMDEGVEYKFIHSFQYMERSPSRASTTCTITCFGRTRTPSSSRGCFDWLRPTTGGLGRGIMERK